MKTPINDSSSLPRELHAGSPSGNHVPVRNLSRHIALGILCNNEHRDATEDERLACFDWVIFDPSNVTHRNAANAIAEQRVQAARLAAGINPEAPPPPKPSRIFSFADIIDYAEGEAARRNIDVQPDSRGILRKYIVDPERAAVLACRLMGGGAAPTTEEVEKCLATAKHIRATAAGDIPLPGGES